MPAERLQIEFLNKWRNPAKYESDPFAPGEYDFSYLFAITMAGQPLAWMEASNLPEEAFEIKPLIETYRKLQHDFHKGVILPIGAEPSGRSWTGFQSIISDTEGYLLIYRENNPEATAFVDTWLTGGEELVLTPLMGEGCDRSLRVSEDGRVKVTIDRPNDFVMYRYNVKR